MPARDCSAPWLSLVAASVLVGGHLPAQDTIQAQATVHLTFDESGGPAADSATVGQSADDGKLVNEPSRVASPFWNQAGGKALQLDAGRQQFVEIPDGPDLDRPDALTISLMVVNLHEPGDAAFHGLIAKRGMVDGKALANYGVNFTQQNDTLQVYLSDGGGYKAVLFSAQGTVPSRKRTFLTVTYQLADAPAQDGDSDADDVRIQLFVNGEQMQPKGVTGGFVHGNDGWITDVNPAGWVNDLPVTIGRSEAGGEYFSGVVDEISLFPRALSGDEVQRLFLEVAGANVRDLMAEDAPVPPRTPAIVSLSQPGIQIGQPTSVTIHGTHLGADPNLYFPVEHVTATVTQAEESRLEATITAAADIVPGWYPLWIRTANGISRPVPIAFDRLPQRPLSNGGPEAPAAIPAAYYGILAGSAQPKVYVAGKKGERLVADVELKRLGGQASPVLEIKSAQGTPLAIAWGHHSLRGDARAEAVLPRDGVYAVELHDLTYNAPGQSPFRLKIGDLRLMDAPFPAVAAAGQAIVEPIGTGFQAEDKWLTTIQPLSESRYGGLLLPPMARVDGPLPPILLESSTEVLEGTAAEGQLQVVAATFVDGSTRPVGINGRLHQRGERDRYLLKVTPGQRLRMVLQTHSLSSSVEGEIAVYQHPQGTVLAMTGEQPSLTDAVLDFTVPADQSQIVVEVRDLLNRGDARSFYRLEIAPGGGPSFEIVLSAPILDVPADGTAILPVQVNRFGYEGPIALTVSGDAGVSVSPTELPAGLSGKALLRLSRQGPPANGASPLLRLMGETVGVLPAAMRGAKLASGAPTPAYGEAVALGAPVGGGLALEGAALPPVLFRGVPVETLAIVKRGVASSDKPVRFSLMTTETPRQRVPNNPAAGMFPMVAVAGTAYVEPGIDQAAVKILAPVEAAETSMDIVLRADSLTHLYSERIVATAYSPPRRVQIQNGVSPKVDEATLAVVSDSEHRVTGQLQRTAGFAGRVEVTLVGLPNEYQATPAVVPGDQSAFAVVVKAPKAAQEQALANVRLRVTSHGSLLLPEQPLNVKVVPPAN